MQDHFFSYFGKFAVSGLMLALSWMDEINSELRIVAAIAGLILTFFTIRRMRKDIEIRNEELKIKRVERREAELRLEQYVTKKHSK